MSRAEFSAFFVMLVACSGAGEKQAVNPRDSGMPVDGGMLAAVDAGGYSVDDAGGAAVGGSACSADALGEPHVATTYYVATQETGADNDACDGSSPTDLGSGHCPFKDFSSPRTLNLLNGVSAVRVEVRNGTYVIRGWGGLPIHGTGSADSERVVLSAYADERPVFDVAAPDGAPCVSGDPTQNPLCVRQVLDVSGTYTLVQGLTIQNGLGYHVAIVGGAHHVFRCNALHETVAFAMRSDCLKLAGDGHDIQVLHNDFSRFRSQAIDITQVTDVLVEDNDFHDPVDADAGATGTKFGARRVTIRNNRIRDFGAATSMHVFSLGGTGTEHPDDHAAYEVRVVGNHVTHVGGLLAQVVSCVDCSVEDNDVSNAGAGVLVSASGTARPECSAAAGGCGANTGTRITGNRFRDLDGGGDPKQSNIFVGVEAGEEDRLVVDRNTYCTPSVMDAPRFLWQGKQVALDAWRMTTMQDAASVVAVDGDSSCKW